MLGVYEIGSERIGEATYTDESFLLGGFNLLWALELGKQDHVLCQGQLLWFSLVCLTVFRFAIYGFQLTEEFWVLFSDSIPNRRECGARVLFSRLCGASVELLG